jgi:hypothetical protein
MRLDIRVRILIAPALASLLWSCSDDPGAPADTTPPATVNTLVAVAPEWDRITLVWTAPGDDGWTGTAARYDIRYSQSPLTEAVWPSATQAEGAPPPKPGGSRDTFVVTGLSPTSYYYFALKTADAAGNWSAKSNIASAATTAKPDNVPPAAERFDFEMRMVIPVISKPMRSDSELPHYRLNPGPMRRILGAV